MVNKALKFGFIGVILNVALSFIAESIASDKEKELKETVNDTEKTFTVDDLNIKEQIVHMLVKHRKTMLSSSILIFIVCFIAYYLNSKM